MDKRRNDISKAAMENTCKWLCDEPEYKDWLARSQRLLWIVGIPGSGKSTIMDYICQQDTDRTEPKDGTRQLSRPQKKLIVASFFCHSTGATLQKNRTGLFRSLLHQILKLIPTLPSEVTSEFDKKCELQGKHDKNWEWHERDLEKMLQTSISYIAKEYPDVYVLRIYVDALDEFTSTKSNGSKEPRDLAEYFQSLTSLDILGIDLNICISCRDYPFIANGGLKVYIENKNRRDILTYVQIKLSGIKGEGYEAQQLIHWIVEKASGIFQWAVMVVEKARDFNEYIETPKGILKELEDLPQGLDKLYEKSFQTMDTDRRSQSLQLLRWVCFAQRPLSVEELHDALLFDSSVTTWQKSMDCKKSSHEMENIIKSLSCNLAVIHKKNEGHHTVQLRHQSVHDYLVSSGLQHLNGSTPTSTPLASSVIHLQLFRFCLHYLSLKEVVTRCDVLKALRVSTEIGTVQFTKSVEYACPFLQYAIKHWTYHAKLAEDDNYEQGDLLQLYQCLSNAPFEKLDEVSAWNYYDERGMTLLHVASQYGLLQLVKWIFKFQNNPNLTSINTNSERHHAVNSVMGKLSQMTFKKVDVDMKTLRGMTPLSFAIKGRQEAMVKHLVENYNANVNTTVLRKSTVLTYAATEGNAEIVKLLLQHSKIKVNVMAEWGGTALTSAASRGNDETIKLLLQHSKTNVNAKDKWGRTALLLAANGGHKGIVAMLLHCSMIKVRAKDKSGTSALMEAVEMGHREIVALLLRHSDVYVNTINMENKTALWYAVQRGNEGMVALLLRHSNIDPNAGNGFLKGPPLCEAVTKRNKAIATLLLQHIEINVNIPGHMGKTPLFIAAQCGDKEMVILLLKKSKADIDISARNYINQSPLTAAIEEEHWTIVGLLLKKRNRMSKADEHVAQALENLSLDERSKMSETMRQSSALAVRENALSLYTASTFRPAYSAELISNGAYW